MKLLSLFFREDVRPYLTKTCIAITGATYEEEISKPLISVIVVRNRSCCSFKLITFF